MLGKEVFAEFDQVARGTPVAAEPAITEEGYRQACLDASLRLEHKVAHFELDHATIENSLRSNLARFANPEVAKRTLDSVRAALPGDARLPFTEPLLLAPSQPDGRARFWRCAARVSAQRPM